MGTATFSRPCRFLLVRTPPQPAPPSPSRLCWHLVAACLGTGWILNLKGEPTEKPVRAQEEDEFRVQSRSGLELL